MRLFRSQRRQIAGRCRTRQQTALLEQGTKPNGAQAHAAAAEELAAGQEQLFGCLAVHGDSPVPVVLSPLPDGCGDGSDNPSPINPQTQTRWPAAAPAHTVPKR